jgi:hypothetical protein
LHVISGACRENPQKFANVLKKFFTGGRQNENKEATRYQRKEQTMFRQIKATAIRSSDTLLGDFLGAAALMVTLIAGLWVPGLF